MAAMQQMLLAGAPQFVLNALAISASSTGPSPPETASVVIQPDGDVFTFDNGTDFNLILSGDPADLEIFVTKNSGDDLDNGTVGSWIALNETWDIVANSVGDFQFFGEYAIRVAATGQVLVSGVTFNLAALITI